MNAMETQMTISPGLEQLQSETSRQFADARATWETCHPACAQAAEEIRATGRLLLLGMGGSHWINRAAEPFYRQAGIDATAHVVSEYMRAPISREATVFLTSQSGASGEVLRYLDTPAAGPVFGLTLDPDSPLATRTHPLLGQGGVEHAYAATRSLLVTLTLHMGVLAALGADSEAFVDALNAPVTAENAEVVAAIAGAKNAVICARGTMQGAADAAALSLMELARIPVLGLEAGQFRHGPFEMVDDESAVIFLRGAGDEGVNIDGLSRELLGHGIRPIVFDFSGEAPVEGALTVSLPKRQGLASAISVLPVLQKAIIDASDRMVDQVGVPIRSRKVTSGEAA
ncbi:SIS domain-containing protein [Thioclava sp. JE_KL1]|nr:SIS domain-containing protein [Thioclava sp. JE_KL1]